MTRQIGIKWSSKELSIEVEQEADVGCLKRKIQARTGVQPKRQKLLGLKTKQGKMASDDVLVSDLALKAGQKIMMVGTPEEDTAAVDAQADVAPHIQDDFDLEEGTLQELDVKDNPDFQEKLQKRIASAEIKALNPPRPGKKCLVLDIDYTIFDLNSTAERPEELARPFLHEFLTAVYEHYDLVIWSATSMKWIEVKMRELGVSTHPAYRLAAFMDHKCMVTIHTARHGVFDCKPLPVLWAKVPQYTAENTIMLDDLRRNYAFNPQNGLVIRPYSLAALKHKKWEHMVASEMRAEDRRLQQPPG